jgi:lipid II:glycine glycyltransferase (peptidoglycan interpeptide bridge formation enzyme)
LAALPRGPVFKTIDALDQCLPLIAETLRRSGVCTLLMNPRWEGSGAALVHEALLRHGFLELPRSEQALHAATGMIDLTRSEGEILAGFKQRCRRQIRAAERKGLIVRPARDEADAMRFAPLLHAFSRRKGFDIAGLPSVMQQWSMTQSGNGSFLLAELNDELVGGHVALCEGKRGFWLVLASDDSASDVPRGYLLLWEGMRQMKRLGCTSFDLAGLPDGKSSDGKEAGREQFKLAFDPQLVQLVRMHVKPLRPVSHAILFRARQAYRQSSLRRYLTPLLRAR